MYDELSEADIQKMKEEIEHRKVVVRKEALAAKSYHLPIYKA